MKETMNSYLNTFVLQNQGSLDAFIVCLNLMFYCAYLGTLFLQLLFKYKLFK